MKTLPIALVLALAACSPGPEQPAANTANTADAAVEADRAKAPVPSLEGEWVVDQLNGKAPDQVWPMTAEVGGGKFTIVSECRRLVWNLVQQGNIVKFTPAAGVECGRVRSPAEHVADRAVELANIAMFSDEGRAVQLTGPGGSVAMRRR